MYCKKTTLNTFSAVFVWTKSELESFLNVGLVVFSGAARLTLVREVKHKRAEVSVAFSLAFSGLSFCIAVLFAEVVKAVVVLINKQNNNAIPARTAIFKDFFTEQK